MSFCEDSGLFPISGMPRYQVQPRVQATSSLHDDVVRTLTFGCMFENITGRRIRFAAALSQRLSSKMLPTMIIVIFVFEANFAKHSFVSSGECRGTKRNIVYKEHHIVVRTLNAGCMLKEIYGPINQICGTVSAILIKQ